MNTQSGLDGCSAPHHTPQHYQYARGTKQSTHLTATAANRHLYPQVVQAMRQTVLNIVGSLPPQYFDVRISAVAESLAQLMLSIMTTGYMLRSAQVGACVLRPRVCIGRRMHGERCSWCSPTRPRGTCCGRRR